MKKLKRPNARLMMRGEARSIGGVGRRVAARRLRSRAAAAAARLVVVVAAVCRRCGEDAARRRARGRIFVMKAVECARCRRDRRLHTLKSVGNLHKKTHNARARDYEPRFIKKCQFQRSSTNKNDELYCLSSRNEQTRRSRFVSLPLVALVYSSLAGNRHRKTCARFLALAKMRLGHEATIDAAGSKQKGGLVARDRTDVVS